MKLERTVSRAAVDLDFKSDRYRPSNGRRVEIVTMVALVPVKNVGVHGEQVPPPSSATIETSGFDHYDLVTFYKRTCQHQFVTSLPGITML